MEKIGIEIGLEVSPFNGDQARLRLRCANAHGSVVQFAKANGERE